ncbi:hypothetical protein ACU4GH_31750 [Bradyrhizobium betae]
MSLAVRSMSTGRCLAIASQRMCSIGPKIAERSKLNGKSVRISPFSLARASVSISGAV